MKRKNRMTLLAGVAATVVLSGCASVPAPQNTADGRAQTAWDIGITRSVWTDCIRAAIPQLDHPEASANGVALAAMNACSAQYTDMSRALVRTLAPSCTRDPNCTRGVLATAQREAVQAATDDVITARVRVAGAQVLQCQ